MTPKPSAFVMLVIREKTAQRVAMVNALVHILLAVKQASMTLRDMGATLLEYVIISRPAKSTRTPAYKQVLQVDDCFCGEANDCELTRSCEDNGSCSIEQFL